MFIEEIPRKDFQFFSESGNYICPSRQGMITARGGGGGGGTQVQRGGRTFVTYFAEEGVFF